MLIGSKACFCGAGLNVSVPMDRLAGSAGRSDHAPTRSSMQAMPLKELNHYFVRVRDLEKSRDFYCRALGFDVMPRPDFPFPGYWLGVGGKVQVHMGLNGIPDEEGFYIGTTPASARDNSGVVDHIAFQATEPDQLYHRLVALGLSPRPRYFAEIQLLQLFVADPDGLVIELNFPGVAAAPRWAAAGAGRASVS